MFGFSFWPLIPWGGEQKKPLAAKKPAPPPPPANPFLGIGGAPAEAAELFGGQFDGPAQNAALRTADSKVIKLDAGQKAGEWESETKHGEAKDLVTVGGEGTTRTHEEEWNEDDVKHVTRTSWGRDGDLRTVGYESSKSDRGYGPGQGEGNTSLKMSGGVGASGAKGEISAMKGKDRDAYGGSAKFDTRTGTVEGGFTAGGMTTTLGRGESGGPVVGHEMKLFGKAENARTPAPSASIGFKADPAAGNYVGTVGHSKLGKVSVGKIDDGFMVSAGNAKGGGGITFRHNDEMTSVGGQLAIGEKLKASVGVTVSDGEVTASASGKAAGFGGNLAVSVLDDKMSSTTHDGVSETSRTSGLDIGGGASVPILDISGGGGHSDSVKHREKLPDGFDRMTPEAQKAYLEGRELADKKGPASLAGVDVDKLADGDGYSVEHEGHERAGVKLGGDVGVVAVELSASHDHSKTSATDLDRKGDAYRVNDRTLEVTQDKLGASASVPVLASVEDKEASLRAVADEQGWTATGPEGKKAVERYLETGLVPGADKMAFDPLHFTDQYRQADARVRALQEQVRILSEAGLVSGAAALVAPLGALIQQRRDSAALLSMIKLASTQVGEELAPGVVMDHRQKQELRRDTSEGSWSFLGAGDEWKNEHQKDRVRRTERRADGTVVSTDDLHERSDDLDGAAEEMTVRISDATGAPAMSFTTRERFEDDKQKIGPLRAAGFAEDPTGGDGVIETQVTLTQEQARAVADTMNSGKDGQYRWNQLQNRVGLELMHGNLPEGVDRSRLIKVNSPEEFAALSEQERDAWLQVMARGTRRNGVGSVFDALGALGGLDPGALRRGLATLVEAARSKTEMPDELKQTAKVMGPFSGLMQAGWEIGANDPEVADLGAQWAQFVNTHPELAGLRQATHQMLGTEGELDQVRLDPQQLTLCYHMGALPELRQKTLQAAFEGGGSARVAEVLGRAGETAESLWQKNSGDTQKLIVTMNLLEGTPMGKQLTEMFHTRPLFAGEDLRRP